MNGYELGLIQDDINRRRFEIKKQDEIKRLEEELERVKNSSFEKPFERRESSSFEDEFDYTHR